MTDWDLKSVLVLVGGIIGAAALWGAFLWSLSREGNWRK